MPRCVMLAAVTVDEVREIVILWFFWIPPIKTYDQLTASDNPTLKQPSTVVFESPAQVCYVSSSDSR
jgi:hypothetical protein